MISSASDTPKPKPRLRVVDFDELIANQPGAGLDEYLRDLDTQPDLLTLLDREIDQALRMDSRHALKDRILAALGVTE